MCLTAQVRYADVLYTMGGSSANFRMARAYYAKAVELTGGQSPRALFGVVACCGNITDKVGEGNGPGVRACSA